MATKVQNRQIEELMRVCGVTLEEALEILEEDKEIDRGEKLHELPKELQAGAKKARQADRKTLTERKPREKKIDADKVELIKRMRNSLNLYTTASGGIQNLEVANDQKEITFTYHGAEYSVTLTKHRAPKE